MREGNFRIELFFKLDVDHLDSHNHFIIFFFYFNSLLMKNLVQEIINDDKDQ